MGISVPGPFPYAPIPADGLISFLAGDHPDLNLASSSLQSKAPDNEAIVPAHLVICLPGCPITPCLLHQEVAAGSMNNV